MSALVAILAWLGAHVGLILVIAPLACIAGITAYQAWGNWQYARVQIWQSVTVAYMYPWGVPDVVTHTGYASVDESDRIPVAYARFRRLVTSRSLHGP